MASEFITRVEQGKDEPYTIIFRTDDADKYKHIEDECRRMIGHEKPTVDAVQVVRCKDCERWTSPIPIEMKEEGYGYCGVLWTNTHEDEYCAWGKRRLVE